jgi:hypothetical protein
MRGTVIFNEASGLAGLEQWPASGADLRTFAESPASPNRGEGPGSACSMDRLGRDGASGFMRSSEHLVDSFGWTAS